VVALPFTLKSIERQKKKKKLYGNVNTSPYKNIIFKKKKILPKKPKSFKVPITKMFEKFQKNSAFSN